MQGGGDFLGYWIAKALELNGYEITFFNTGKNTPRLFSNFYTKVGDRRDYINKKFFVKYILISIFYFSCV